MRSQRWGASLFLFLVALGMTFVFGNTGSAARPLTGITTRVSVGPGGVQGNNLSRWANLSADGRYVAFESRAGNLVPGDTNAHDDIFVHDRQTGTTVRASIATDGTQGNRDSGQDGDGPGLSADGRYVVFDSPATNLVPGDTNNNTDVFRRDLVTGETLRASVASGGAQGNHGGGATGDSVSSDGRYVAFGSFSTNLVPDDTNGDWDIFVHDMQDGTTERVSVSGAGGQSNAESREPQISADGRYVVFRSTANNLVTGDTNGVPDIFVHDRQTGSTVRVSVASGGTQANAASQGAAISANGDYVAFASRASNLVAGDTNGVWDVFVHALQAGTTTRVSVGPGGLQANENSGLYEAWYYLVVLAISSDGRYVAFGSGASNLVAGDTNNVWDVFVHDRQTGETTRISLASDDTQGNDFSAYPSLALEPRYVGFGSYASNLVPGDTNGVADSFVRDSVVPTPTPTVTGTPPTPTPTHTATTTATPAPTSTPLPTAVCEPPRPAGWSPIAPLPTTVRGPGVAGDGVYVYATGGFSDGAGGPVGQVARYDLPSNTWTPLAPMLDPAYGHAVVYGEGKLYVFGGGTNVTYLNSTRIYDIGSNTWSFGEPMPDRRTDLMAGYYAGRIYVVGGVDSYSVARKQTWAYDIASDTWSSCADAPVVLAEAGAAVAGGRLYVLGGRDANYQPLRTVYDYDPATDTWRSRAGMATEHRAPGTAVVRGRVWVIGGVTDYSVTGVTELYDPAADTWIAGPTLNVPRSMIGAAGIDRAGIAVGGFDGSGTSLAAAEISMQMDSLCAPLFVPAALDNAGQP